MFRKIATLISGLILAALLMGGTASAAPETPLYPAPSVSVASASSSAPVSSVAAVADPAPAQQANVQVRGVSESLPNTGAGFEVGTAIAIGGAIVLAGLVLVLIGSRRTFGAAKTHQQ